MADLISMLAAAAGAGGEEAGYQISRSLRFNSADSAYLNRTPATASNRKTWTWSGWVKLGTLGIRRFLFAGGSGITDTTNNSIEIRSDNRLTFQGGVTQFLITSQLFRDPSAWYHIVCAFDSTQATASNRVKLYLNGSEITAFATDVRSSITQNTDYGINNNTLHCIGATSYNASPALYNDGYLTEVHFVDGQALTPSDFGETDATTGVWKPKAYAGTYGTNGFYLDFSDNSSTTALGTDSSGNGNNWTPNNFSVTAGAGNDSLVDTPTPYGTDTGVGGEVRGNYCTLNPLYYGTAGTSLTFSNGNLENASNRFANNNWASSTIVIPSSGKWYCEVMASGTSSVGVIDITTPPTSANPTAYRVYYGNTGTKGSEAGFVAYGATFTVTDVIGIAVDMDAGTIVFYKNGVSQGTAFSDLVSSGKQWCFGPYYGGGTTNTTSWNFGQRPFAYTAPSGFKALCTQNLPAPTVVQGDDYFNTVLYTGNGSTQSITGVGFQPDWVWIKGRSAATSHYLFDAIRGVNNTLFSEATDAETTTNALTAFGSDGFTVSWNASYGGTNTNAATYVGWNWNAGGSNATNTDGTITSTVRANPTAGFSIVSYTGNGSTSPYPTVGHGLGVTPKLIITKTRSTTSNWVVYTTVIDGSLDFLYLNTNAAAANSGLPTAPTSTVFQVGGADNNASGATVIAYCFAEVEGFSKIGSYTGNGSTDGPFVYCGFRPAFVMFKITSTTGAWAMWDTKRAPYNVFSYFAPVANASTAEASNSAYALDLLSNGFKPRGNNDEHNLSGATIIFMAFAENPFKYSLAR